MFESFTITVLTKLSVGSGVMYPMVPGSTVTLERGKDGMVGLTIGGGAPYCPCLYVVQVTCQEMGHNHQVMPAVDLLYFLSQSTYNYGIT